MARAATLDIIDQDSKLAALLSPLRRQILELLHEKPDSASGLSRKLGLPRQKVNYHVRMLEREALLELESEEQRRGCVERRLRPTARVCLVQPDLLGQLSEGPDRERGRFSSGYLLRLAARLLRDVAQLRRGASQARKPLATFALEMEVRFGSPAERTAFAEELTEAAARLAARYQQDGPNSRPHHFVIAGHPVSRKEASGGKKNAN